MWFLLKVFQFPFIVGQSVATALAMIGNFVLVTKGFRDLRSCKA
jgi:hypothetical protein